MTLFKLKNDDKGYAAVEFAMILPIFLILIFGVVELGSAWYTKQMLTSASREGARLGILHASEGITSADVVNQVNTFLTNSGFPGIANINVTGVGGATGSQVRVEVSTNWDLPVLGRLVPAINESITLQAATVMRHE